MTVAARLWLQSLIEFSDGICQTDMGGFARDIYY